MYINYTCDEALLGADIERGPIAWLLLCALPAEVAIMGPVVGAEMVRQSAEFIESSASVVWRIIGALIGGGSVEGLADSEGILLRAKVWALGCCVERCLADSEGIQLRMR